jgi:hypothetical protein
LVLVEFDNLSRDSVSEVRVDETERIDEDERRDEREVTESTIESLIDLFEFLHESFQVGLGFFGVVHLGVNPT